MPHNEQAITLNNIDINAALAIAYQAMRNLGWQILHADKNSLTGTNRKEWSRRGQLIKCSIVDNTLVVRSEMVKGELIDIAGINKKNVRKFIEAFNNAIQNISADRVEENNNAINEIKTATVKAAYEHAQMVEEANKIMRKNGSNLYATYAIIAVNVIVFVLMILDGAGLFEYNDVIHIKWGSNYRILTLSGDWWRLITNIFIHFGLVHILLNMYCLYVVAGYLEPMLGKAKYITAYICTGIIASVASLWWHSEGVNSAGASGAIFGMYGLFFAMLTTNLIPKNIRDGLLKSIGLFIVYNLFFGIKSGIDNAAHIGGLISGFIIGYLYVFGIKKEQNGEQSPSWIIPAVIIATICGASYYLKENIVPDKDRIAFEKELANAAYKDYDIFNDKLSQFDSVNEKMNNMLMLANNASISNADFAKKIQTEGLPEWEKEYNEIAKTTQFDLSAESHAKAEKLLEYITLRKKELEIRLALTKDPNNKALVDQVNAIETEYNDLFDKLVNE